VTLREAQSLFVGLLGQLLVWAYTHDGWSFTLADGYRADCQGHMKDSLHYERLAQDLNFFLNGVWQKTGSDEWEQIGTYWLALNPLCRWGGTFTKKDWNHFSLAWEGRA